jgi:TPP-dependent pyruvate/acetoin dehydrogenase alpha subunit
VAFFGDGAVAHGTFHEAINLAAVWRLPVIFFCENNGYAEFSPASDQHAAPLERRAAGYGVDYVAVDGNDVVATAGAMIPVTEATRAGRGPSSSRQPPTAGADTTKATRSATDRPTKFGSGKHATLCSSTRACSDQRASRTTRSNPCSLRSRTISTKP